MFWLFTLNYLNAFERVKCFRWIYSVAMAFSKAIWMVKHTEFKYHLNILNVTPILRFKNILNCTLGYLYKTTESVNVFAIASDVFRWCFNLWSDFQLFECHVCILFFRFEILLQAFESHVHKSNACWDDWEYFDDSRFVVFFFLFLLLWCYCVKRASCRQSHKNTSNSMCDGLANIREEKEQPSDKNRKINDDRMHVSLGYRDAVFFYFALLRAFFRFYLVDLFNFHSLTYNPSADYHQCESLFGTFALSIRFQFLVLFFPFWPFAWCRSLLSIHFGVWCLRHHWLENKPMPFNGNHCIIRIWVKFEIILRAVF